MERIVKTPIYKVNLNEEKVLMYTIIKTFSDTLEIVEGIETTVSDLIQTKRIMPNGDYYIIN